MKTVVYAKGDGIGPEIMDATIDILKAAGVKLNFEEIEIGKKAYERGIMNGIPKESWDKILEHKVLLKAPITTPQGGGYKSLNVTLRKTLGLFANVRPCKSMAPFVASRHPQMDVVVIRENEEDLYAGIEHQQTAEVVQCLKLITRPGTEKIVRYAFEYAKAYGRKKVTCFVKDNIMKQTDGLFHKIFKEIAAEYPEIESDHIIIDIGAARIADTPEMFDVVVMPNLYGDVVSDITAQLSGSVGLAGSSNIGQKVSMFEAIHGSAPDIAGKDIANPSALINASVMMLNHLGDCKSAEKIHNAWLRTIEDGIHTADIYHADSKEKVGTRKFAEAVIARLGLKPEKLNEVSYDKMTPIKLPEYIREIEKREEKKLVGVDVFIDHPSFKPEQLAEALRAFNDEKLSLSMITNRGVKVWPEGFDETFCTDHWRCRFDQTNGKAVESKDVAKLLCRLAEGELDAIKTENLYTFNGERGYSLGQGQG
ncbi:MAG: isocitrate dehydrogenase [Flavobacteriales bacterium]|nr:isocitrate dehydrogenase [Flavobacteriales bacterium]